MPRKHLPIEKPIKTRRLETYDQILPILYLILYQIINFKLLSFHPNHTIQFRVDLPITIIIIHIQVVDGFICQFIPSQEANEYLLYVFIVFVVI